MNLDNKNSISLNKFISNTGKCSRREADEMILHGRVLLNNKEAKAGNRVFEGDIVKIDGKVVKSKRRPLYIAFNKPKGIVCTTDLSEPNNIISYLNHPQRLFPIGRLDKLSEGLIFLTNDGDIVNKILRDGNNHEKEYIVRVKQVIHDKFIDRMSNGVPILGTRTKKCKVQRINDHSFKITLTQGLNRQIRRMCEFLKYDVQSLRRVRIMNVRLGKLGTGAWRNFTDDELSQINQMIKGSSKTQEASKSKLRNKSRSKKKTRK